VNKIIYIADPEIIVIPIIECYEPMIDLKNQNKIAYGPPPEYAQTINDYTWIRKTIFDKLCEVQNDLPNGWRLRIYEGYRSLPIQKMLFDTQYKRFQRMYPNHDHSFIFHETTSIVSPINNSDGSINIPPHNTGAAVDVEIITDDNQIVDMGMEAKDWNTAPPELCFTHCERLSDTIKNNRQILITRMQNHGFINYPTEWWHFSYGDRYWAYHTNSPNAIYGSWDHAIKNEKIYNS
jgi:D-alanyl-D-alanine dipeptidase